MKTINIHNTSRVTRFTAAAIACFALSSGPVNAGTTSGPVGPGIIGELGVLDASANGGINPATGSAWAIGDQYRLVFLTSQTTTAESSDITTYNDFVQGVAASSTTYPLLGNTTWRIIGSTSSVDARDNTGTNPAGEPGVAIFLTDGTTKIADNNADMWDNNIDNFINRNENGSAQGGGPFAGSWPDGTKKELGSNDNALGVNAGDGTVQVGNPAQTDTRWIRSWKAPYNSQQVVYAMSDVLTIPDPATVPPVIALIGGATVQVLLNGPAWVDPGANATDAQDGTLTAVVGGDTVDVSTKGTYVITYDVTDSDGNAAPQVTRTVIVTDAAVVYEPFDYTPGNLSGAGGTTEVGLDGNWSASGDTKLVADSLTYGSLITSGGAMGGLNGSVNRFGGARSISSTALAGNGLLDDGATLWFSLEMGYDGGNATNTTLAFALANDQFTGGNYSYQINNDGPQLGQGIGVFMGRDSGTNGTVRAASFSDPSVGTGFNGVTYGNRVGGAILGSTDHTLIVGKITWGVGAANDTIELYNPDSDLNLGAAISTLSVDVDQSTFDTITFERGDKVAMDEIRFGKNYPDVVPAPPLITLAGDPTVQLIFNGSPWVDPGATAFDLADGTLPVTIGGDTVDVSTKGTYFITYDAVDSDGNAAEQVTRTVLVVGGPVVEESFDYATGTVTGNDGGRGFMGAWNNTRNNPTVSAPGDTWGDLITAGNQSRGNAWSGLQRPLGTPSSLDAAGLMDDGGTLWFSVIMGLAEANTTNADLNLSLGTDRFESGAFGDRENLIGGEGIGVTHSGGRIQAVYWQNNDADAIAERNENNSSLLIGPQAGRETHALVVGKIEWGSGPTANETITLYAPGNDLALGPEIMASWSIPALDQSQFDTLALQYKDSTPTIDEIRFGASYLDVTPSAPLITLNGSDPIDLEFNVDGWSDPGATAFDRQDGPLTVVVGGDTVDPSTKGTYVITYDAVDLDGFAAAQVTRTVNVADTLPPVISCAKQIVVTVPEGQSATVNYEPTAFDAGDGVLPVVCDPPSGSSFAVGNHVVTCTAVDSEDNEAIATFNVVVLVQQPVNSDRFLDGVSVRGDDAEGTGVAPGATILAINNAFLNDNGDVVFDASLQGNGANNSAVFFRPDGGSPAPVAAKGASFGAGAYGIFSNLSLNDAGDIGFQSLTSGNLPGHFAGPGAGPVANSARRLGASPSGGVYNGLYQPALASNGELLTPAALLLGNGGVTSLNDSVITSSAGTVVAREGSPSGIGAINHGQFLARVVASDADGRYAFPSLISESPPTGGNAGIFVGQLGGSPTLAVRKGDAAAGTPGTFSSFLGESVNSDGEIALRALVFGAGVNASNNEGIWTNSGNTSAPPVLVAREGDVTPCIAGGLVAFSSFKTVYMGDDGSVCFLAYLKDSDAAPFAMVNASNDASIWLWRNGALDLIVREGDLANSTDGAVVGRIVDFDSNGDADGGNGIAYSVEFAPISGDTTSRTNQAVYVDRGGEDLAPVLVLRRGDKFTVGEDEVDVLSLRISSAQAYTPSGSTGGFGRAINGDGDVLLNVGFTGSKSGIFVLGSPPVVVPEDL